MTASIRSICLAALLSGGAAWAQQTQENREMAGMDHGATMKNATPQMMLQKHAEMADQLKGPAAMGRTPENR